VIRELRDKVREAWRRLRGGDLTPARAAASVAVGLAIGVTPLYGFHLPLVIAVCVPLGLDTPVAYLAANISLPFIAPFLTMAEIEIGSKITTGAWLSLTREALREYGIKPFLRQIVVGTIIFSPLVASVGASLTFAVASLFRKTPEPDSFEAIVDRVADRYARGSKFTRGYVRSKMSSDPIVRTLFDRSKENGFGEVADVGCGRGQLSVMLLEAKAATKIAGFDWDEAKIEEAKRAAASLHGSAFFKGDLRSHEIAACDTSLLLDVLHYLTADEQDALLDRVAVATRKTIFVRELDPDRGWRSSVTRFQERVTTRIGVNRGARVLLRPISAIAGVLERNGFDVEVAPCWAGTPFSNVLITATRHEKKATAV
jgi:uncharacterized protein (DUF2062 family)/SAM-dependent methyltransferase